MFKLITSNREYIGKILNNGMIVWEKDTKILRKVFIGTTRSVLRNINESAFTVIGVGNDWDIISISQIEISTSDGHYVNGRDFNITNIDKINRLRRSGIGSIVWHPYNIDVKKYRMVKGGG